MRRKDSRAGREGGSAAILNLINSTLLYCRTGKRRATAISAVLNLPLQFLFPSRADEVRVSSVTIELINVFTTLNLCTGI